MKQSIWAKQIDSSPTQNSGNLITSGAAKAILDEKVNKAGDVMTGDLILTSSGNYPTLRFHRYDDAANGPQEMIQTSEGGTASRFGFYQRINGSSAWEGYRLPITETSLSSGVGYDILTSKTPVTVAQGGTGAATAAAALTNLGAVNKAGDTMTGNLIIDTGSNYRGILIKGASNASTVRIYNTGGAFVFDQYANGSTGGDRYLLPDIKAHDGDVWYGILTTKPNSGILYYGAGETYSTSTDMMICGHITSGTKVIQLGLWLPKSLEKISKISVTNLVGAIRGTSGYINNWTANTNILTQSGITVDATRTFPNGIRLHIENTSEYTNITNNTPVAFSGKVTLSFS